MKDIIILGRGQSGKCDFKADEVWGINGVGDKYPDGHFDKMFAFDTFPEWYTDNMRKFAPIVSWRDYADIKYPLKSITKYFKSEYFTNTITYMIALAIYQKVERISLYGIDASYGGQYHQDKSGVEYWIGRAIERGIDVVCPKDSHLLRTVTGEVYGGEIGGHVKLQLSERTILTNLLPRVGSYEDMVKVTVITGLLSPKASEGKEHKIGVRTGLDGITTYACDEDFTRDIWLAPHAWKYLADILKGLHEEESLPVGATGLYEKLVLLPRRNE